MTSNTLSALLLQLVELYILCCFSSYLPLLLVLAVFFISLPTPAHCVSHLHFPILCIPVPVFASNALSLAMPESLFACSPPNITLSLFSSGT